MSEAKGRAEWLLALGVALTASCTLDREGGGGEVVAGHAAEAGNASSGRATQQPVGRAARVGPGAVRREELAKVVRTAAILQK